MSVHYYDRAVISFDGKPVATAESVTMSHEPDPTPIAATFSGRVDMSALAEMFGVARLPPSQPRGYITIPYGILGPIRLQGIVDTPSWQVTESGATGAFRMAENEVERAVSMAVQRAICNPRERLSTLYRAVSLDGNRRAAKMVRDASQRGRYHGERKQRRAMRRLLRAAGILGEKR